MTFLNPLLLYGALLIAVPVLLHLLMRQKPKKLLFPALRLIEARRKSNVRRLRLRHVWLLLLRMAVIGLLVLAMARPSLPAANYAPDLGECLTLAALFAVALGFYYGVLRWWRKQSVPHHVLAYRRMLLRGGTAGGFVLLVLLAVAWPYQRRIAAEISAPVPPVAENLPVAAVFLFDTSLSMGYAQENKTRLARAQEIATAHLSRLPARSRVAVADASTDGPILFQADLASAQARLEALQLHAIHLPLDDRVLAAVRLQEEDVRRTLEMQESLPAELRKDEFLREIYLFTDLAKSAWRPAASGRLRQTLAQMEWLQVYVIDVGVAQPTNVAVTSVRLSKQTAPAGGEVVVHAAVQATGIGDEERTVELYVQGESGQFVKQGQSTVQLAPGAAAPVSFPVRGLAQPIAHGELRALASDPLEFDDTAYFTIGVRPPLEILLASDNYAQAVYWREALAPSELTRLGKARYRCTYKAAAQLEAADLTPYAAVCLINAASPSETAWRKLARYVEGGGGLAVFLGMPNDPVNPPAVSYNSEAAQSVLPAELLAELAFRPAAKLDPGALTHPIFEKFDQLGGAGLLTSADVRRYWRVRPHKSAAVIARFNDRRQTPALLERALGSGRTVLLATAVDLKTQGRSWNDLPLAQWQFVALADQMMQYLAGQSDAVFNFSAGQQVLIRLAPGERVGQYLLRKPGLQQIRGEAPADATYLPIGDADQIGHYDLIGADEQSTFRSGFSVNAPPGESDFTRLGTSDLDQLLGVGRYGLAPSVEELERVVTRGRLGQEVFPLVLAVMVVVFAAEHLAANRFYEAE